MLFHKVGRKGRTAQIRAKYYSAIAALCAKQGPSCEQIVRERELERAREPDRVIESQREPEREIERTRESQ